MPYYARVRGKVVGPFDEARLHALIKQGRIGRTHEISEDKTTWKRADEYDNLFPAAEPYESPNADTQVETQPQAPAEPAVQWYYSLDGKQPVGPVDESLILDCIRQGVVNEDTLAWRAGDESSARLASFHEFASFFTQKRVGVLSFRDSQKAAPSPAAMSGDPVAPKVVHAATQSRPWVILVALSFALGVGSSVVGAIIFIARLLALSSDQDENVTVTLISFLVFGAVFFPLIKTVIAMARYTMSFDAILLHQNDTAVESTLRHLGLFWKWLGMSIIVIVFLVVLGYVFVATRPI